MLSYVNYMITFFFFYKLYICILYNTFLCLLSAFHDFIILGVVCHTVKMTCQLN